MSFIDLKHYLNTIYDQNQLTGQRIISKWAPQISQYQRIAARLDFSMQLFTLEVVLIFLINISQN